MRKLTRTAVVGVVLTNLAISAHCCFAQVKQSVTEPFEISKIASAEQGVIQRILVREGQQIDADQALAELNQGVLQQRRKLAAIKAQSTADVDAAAAALKLRKKQRENMQELTSRGHGNPFEVEQAVAQYEEAVAQYTGAREEREQSQAELAQIDAELRRRSIRSPIGGIVTEIHKRHGEFIASSDPVFATVVQLDRLRVRFYLEADTTATLREGQNVMVYVGRKRRSVAGTIEFVSPIVEPRTGLARVNVLIDNRESRIRSGIVCYWDKRSDESKRGSQSAALSPPGEAVR